MKSDYTITAAQLYTKEEQAKIHESMKAASDAAMARGQMRPCRDYIAIVILCWTGIKSSELITLRWETVDLMLKKIVVGRRGRGVKIPEKLCVVLRWYYQYTQARINDYILWSDRDRSPWSPAAFNRAMKKAGETCGIKIDPRRIRHTYARNFYHLTGDLQATKRQLGHKSLEFTLLYTSL